MENIRAIVIEDIELIERNLNLLIESNNVIFSDLDNFISGSSKRIRSILSLLYLRGCGYQPDDKIISLLTAGELIHNASLLHDDVIDNSNMRRGNISFQNKHCSSIAVICGDYLLSIAVKILADIDNKEVMNKFLKTVEIMTNAEISQFLSRNKILSLSQYTDIAAGKTASLFKCILECISLLAGMDVYKSGLFGYYFGLAFQVNNDLTKDSIENDKLNGLNTIVDILGIEKTNILKDNYKKEMREIMKDLSDSVYKNGLEDLIDKL